MKEPTFYPEKSLELDRAQAALEDAQAKGDKVREHFAREWVRKLEAEIFGGSDETL